MMRLAIGLLLFVFPVALGHAQGQKHNGFWWKSSTADFRIGFATGYAMAMTAMYDRGSLICLPKKDEAAMRECIESEVLPFDFTKIPLGQLSDGVDEFYKDFRSENLDIVFAMHYVRDELKGKPPQELEKELDAARRISQH